MTGQVLSIFERSGVPDPLLPSLSIPVGSAMPDSRKDFDQLQKGMRAAWGFAEKNHLAVLTVAGDRNGAYLVIAPCAYLAALFGNDAGCWRKEPAKGGHTLEYWMAEREQFRVFWREVK